MHNVTPPPPDCEEINSQADLARRLLCSRVEAGRRITSGKIRPHSSVAGRVFYKCGDVNKWRGAAIQVLAEKCSKLNASERERIVHLFAEISAAENNRTIPTVEDFAAGQAKTASNYRPHSRDSWLNALVARA